MATKPKPLLPPPAVRVPVRRVGTLLAAPVVVTAGGLVASGSPTAAAFTAGGAVVAAGVVHAVRRAGLGRRLRRTGSPRRPVPSGFASTGRRTGRTGGQPGRLGRVGAGLRSAYRSATGRGASRTGTTHGRPVGLLGRLRGRGAWGPSSRSGASRTGSASGFPGRSGAGRTGTGGRRTGRVAGLLARVPGTKAHAARSAAKAAGRTGGPTGRTRSGGGRSWTKQGGHPAATRSGAGRGRTGGGTSGGSSGTPRSGAGTSTGRKRSGGSPSGAGGGTPRSGGRHGARPGRGRQDSSLRSFGRWLKLGAGEFALNYRAARDLTATSREFVEEHGWPPIEIHIVGDPPPVENAAALDPKLLADIADAIVPLTPEEEDALAPTAKQQAALDEEFAYLAEAMSKAGTNDLAAGYEYLDNEDKAARRAARRTKPAPAGGTRGARTMFGFDQVASRIAKWAPNSPVETEQMLKEYPNDLEAVANAVDALAAKFASEYPYDAKATANFAATAKGLRMAANMASTTAKDFRNAHKADFERHEAPRRNEKHMNVD